MDHKNLQYLKSVFLERLNTLVRQGGLSFLVSSGSLSPTGRGLRTPNQMLCPACMNQSRLPRNQNPSYHLTVWW
ncbi:hypothetical protein L3Q82_019008 [Scortum barcoo]|uniref:Uncharacterized protein n=1 Tax=Scortum barcoo TaxID=214431 RepID=A0ACB8VG53_9TELE|nr:hypothetical protein L3Q82_019008 [Scortum barcoo]